MKHSGLEKDHSLYCNFVTYNVIIFLATAYVTPIINILETKMFVDYITKFENITHFSDKTFMIKITIKGTPSPII